MSTTKKMRQDGRWLLSGLCIFLVLMLGVPTLTNLWYSVSDVTFFNLLDSNFIGFENFGHQLTSQKMWDALGFSLKFGVICTILEVGIALALVLFLHTILTKRPWLMAFLMMPMMISPALLGVMYRLLLNEFIGIVPQYLEIFGFYINFLGPENIYMTVVIIEVMQWMPFAFLILLAARQAIPPVQEEAAGMDGATPLQLTFFVLLPAMLPVILIVIFIRFIDSFRVFDHIFVLTGGGPGNSTTSISIYIYKLFFNQNELGQAVAVSLILLAMSLTLLFATMQLILRKD